jgi:serine/threonine protein kinase
MALCEHCKSEHGETEKFCPNTGKIFAPERFFPIGKLLEGKYLVGRPIGIGGMGAVFEATHTLLQKKVAVKILLPEFARDEEMRRRLMREARAASATGHRNIVAVSDLGTTPEGGVFIVMEHLSGRSLKELIAQSAPLAISRAAGLTAQILAALEAVHKKGIVHRDLKPDNIIVTIEDDGHELLKVLDFGVSKLVGAEHELEETGLTTIGRLMGTPRYMSPEQVEGLADLDHRADLFACGGILYTMLTARPPFVASTLNQMIVAILAGKVTPPSQVVSTIPREVDVVVLRALARRREDRFPDASTFRRALQPFVVEEVGVTEAGLGPRPPAAAAAVQTGTPLYLADIELVTLDQVQSRRLERPPAAETLEPSARELPGADGVEIPLEVAPAAQSPTGRPAPTDPDRLEIETAYYPDQIPVAAAASRTGSLHAAPPLRWDRLVLLLAAVVVLGATSVFVARHGGRLLEELRALLPSETVMLYVETEPKEASIYWDGVRQIANPFEVRRSRQAVGLRVLAPGYAGRRIEVVPDTTRNLKVKLVRPGAKPPREPEPQD